MSRKPRKILAGILVILGGLLMWLVPDVSTVGFVILLLGVALEVIGIYLEHQDSQ
jgi:membrane-bound ClpP family serine protease